MTAGLYTPTRGQPHGAGRGRQANKLITNGPGANLHMPPLFLLSCDGAAVKAVPFLAESLRVAYLEWMREDCGPTYEPVLRLGVRDTLR